MGVVLASSGENPDAFPPQRAFAGRFKQSIHVGGRNVAREVEETLTQADYGGPAGIPGAAGLEPPNVFSVDACGAGKLADGASGLRVQLS